MVSQALSLDDTRENDWQRRPPLESGDRLSRAEFHRRYALYPEVKKAELIEGVVIVGSPVHRQHSRPHFQFSAILGVYCAHTPGLIAGDNESVVFDGDNELQPDLFVGIEAARGGQLEDSEDGPLSGVPEFVVEVAASSSAYDLHSKLTIYQRNGVQEYLVLLAYDGASCAFSGWRTASTYWLSLNDETGVLRHSRVLPGFLVSVRLVLGGESAVRS